MKIKTLAQIALFAALLCILCPLAIPFGPIPVTLASFAILLTAAILPWKQAAAAVFLYILMGCIGLPVFSGGQAGFAVLLGPTGGYLWCYVPMAVLASAGSRRGTAGSLLFSAAALALLYVCGTIQYGLMAGVDFAAAFAACVLPFIAFDVLKLIAACLLGQRIRRRLTAAGLLEKL